MVLSLRPKDVFVGVFFQFFCQGLSDIFLWF